VLSEKRDHWVGERRFAAQEGRSIKLQDSPGKEKGRKGKRQLVWPVALRDSRPSRGASAGLKLRILGQGRLTGRCRESV